MISEWWCKSSQLIIIIIIIIIITICDTYFWSDGSVRSVLVRAEVDFSVSEVVALPSFLLVRLSTASLTPFFNLEYLSFSVLYLSSRRRFSQRNFSKSTVSCRDTRSVCFLTSFSVSREKSDRISSSLCLYTFLARSSCNYIIIMKNGTVPRRVCRVKGNGGWPGQYRW